MILVLFRRRIYRIRFHFFAFSHYENELAVTPDDIINYVEQKFLKILVKAVQKQMKIEQKRRYVVAFDSETVEFLNNYYFSE